MCTKSACMYAPDGGCSWYAFRRVSLRVTPWGDFLCEQKVTKESHRERVFPLKGLSRWAAVATFYLNEPSPATTEVGLRSPFWNPLRLVQCLTLPTDFFAKNELGTKNDAGLLKLCHPLEGIKGEPRTVPLWRFKGGVSKGAGKTQSPPLL